MTPLFPVSLSLRRRPLALGLFAAAAVLQAGVTVTLAPRGGSRYVDSGKRRPLEVTVSGSPDTRVTYSVVSGPKDARIDPFGVFHAPKVVTLQPVIIEARSRADATACARIRLLVLPPGQEAPPPGPGAGLTPLPGPIEAIVAEYAPELLLVQSPLRKLPFLDVATSLRWTADPVRDGWMGRPDLDLMTRWNPFGFRRVVGVDVPFQVSWLPVSGAAGQLLSYGDAYHPRDSTHFQDAGPGRSAIVRLRHSARVMVEALGREEGKAGDWVSHRYASVFRVRGLELLAGQPGSLPGVLDGRGSDAEFEAPSGIVWARTGRDPRHLREAVVTEPGRNVLRCVAPDGWVETRWGDSAAPGGYRDGAHDVALFNRPTHLAKYFFDTILVADSGNNLIRLLERDGTVSTYAGIHGDHPFANGPLDQATFNDPQGLAVVSAQDVIYVADRGSCTIRAIGGAHPRMVTTYAGEPGVPGTLDGTGTAARFQRPGALAIGGPRGDLFLLDQHALRRIGPDRKVELVAGSVLEPDFRDQGWPGATGHPGASCFRDPQGLVALGPNHLYIADTGNNAVREVDLSDAIDPGTGALDPAKVRVRTLVGAPARTRTQGGLFKDALHALPESYASVAAPRGLCQAEAVDVGEGSLVLAADTCVGLLSSIRPPSPFPHQDRPAPAVVLKAGSRAVGADGLAVGEAYTISFTVPNAASFHPRDATGWDFLYTVEFVDADHKALGAPRTETGSFAGGPTVVQGIPFTTQGTGTVVVRYVTVHGFSADTVVQVPVRLPGPREELKEPRQP